MSFCSKCGAQISGAGKFCPSCGAPVENAQHTEQSQQAQSGFGATIHNLNDTPDTTVDYDKTDIEQNKWMAALSYLGPLVFIPLFVKKDSPYVQYHAKQGINMFAVWVAHTIICGLLSLIKVRKIGYVFGIPYDYMATPAFVSVIICLISLAVSALAIIGIVNALSGKAKQLPIIGGISIIK